VKIVTADTIRMTNELAVVVEDGRLFLADRFDALRSRSSESFSSGFPAGLYPGYLDVDAVRSTIDAVQQGARDALLVAAHHPEMAHLGIAAGALLHRVAIPATRAGIAANITPARV
jgi:hypothetical protein